MLTREAVAQPSERRQIIMLALLLVGVPATTSAQTIGADGTITFVLKAPNAQVVQLMFEGSRPEPMKRASDGSWSVTLPPQEPDIYEYSFLVDGVTVRDSAGPSATVHVKGTAPLLWESVAVPHGVLHQHFYRSTIESYDRDYFVYTPPGYEASQARYPVLYLLHGAGGSSGDWIRGGRVHLMLDNLIAQQKVTPMLVVMPTGYGMPNYMACPACTIGWYGAGHLQRSRPNCSVDVNTRD